jgi:type I site-specific restriction-modification system R (restriction) subunit
LLLIGHTFQEGSGIEAVNLPWDPISVIINASEGIIEEKCAALVTGEGNIVADIGQGLGQVERREVEQGSQALEKRFVRGEAQGAAQLGLADQARTRSNEEIETAIRQIVNDTILSSEVIGVFDAAGIKKPDISILSDEFLAEVQAMDRKNLALELLKRLLNDEIKSRSKMNLVQGKKFSEMLAEAVKRYQSGLVDSARIIEELIQLAKDIRAADQRGEKMNLRVD